MMDFSSDINRQGTASNIDTSVIPMINVVFLILMFFLVAGRLQSIDAVGIDVPLSSTTEPIRGNDEVIELADHGMITWRGKPLQLEDLRSMADRRELAFPKKMIVLTSAGMRSASVLELIMVLKHNSVSSISLVTVNESELTAASI